MTSSTSYQENLNRRLLAKVQGRYGKSTHCNPVGKRERLGAKGVDMLSKSLGTECCSTSGPMFVRDFCLARVPRYPPGVCLLTSRLRGRRKTFGQLDLSETTSGPPPSHYLVTLNRRDPVDRYRSGSPLPQRSPRSISEYDLGKVDLRSP